MTEIFYIRHGLTQWNVDGRLQGHSDIPLCEEGIVQVKLLALNLKNMGIEKVISSPLQRTFETGKIIAQALNVPIETDVRLMERNFGSFEGIHHHVLVTDHGLKPGQSLSEVLPPDAELLEDVAGRVWPLIEDLASKPEKVLLVSHAGVFRALWQARINKEFSELKFGKIWQFTNDANEWSINPTEVVL